MEIQGRVVSSSSSGRFAFAADLGVALAILLVAAHVTAGVVHPRTSISTSRPPAGSASVHQQAPDAAERNGVYYEALCSGYNDASPDARDRNIALSGC
jgi:hypothetical protein